LSARKWYGNPATLWFLLLTVLGCWALATTRVQTELSLLFPEGRTSKQQLLLNALREGPSSRLILIGLEGAPIDVLTEANRVLAANMQKTRDFVSINNGERANTGNEKDQLFRYRYLLSPNIKKARFTTHGLHQALANRLHELTTPLSSLLKSKLPADPTNEYWHVVQSWMTDTKPRIHKGLWVTPDRSRSLLLAETKAAGFDLDKQRHIQSRIRKAFRLTLSKDPTFRPIRLLLTGPAVFAVETERTVKTESTWLSLIALMLVAAFLVATFRSPTPMILSLVPLFSGMVAAVVSVNLLFGFIHGITLAFGATLIGVTVDYPIHLFSHLVDGDSVKSRIADIWPTMFLGAGTTIIGYGALWFSGFPGLAQLGLFAIVGVLVACVVTRWVLPPLIPKPFPTNRLGKPAIRLTHFFQRGRSLFLLLIILPVFYLGVSTEPFWETDIANFTTIPREEKELDRQLRQAMGAPSVRDLIVITGPTEQDVLGHSEALKQPLHLLVQQGAMEGYDLATRYLPSRKTQVSRQAALPDPETLKTHLLAAMRGLPFKKHLFEPFLQDVAQARMQDTIASEDFQGTTLELKLQSLLFKDKEQWVSVVPLRAVKDRGMISQWNDVLEDPRVFYLDLKEQSHDIIVTYRDEALRLVSWGTFAICVVLAIRIRSLWLFSSVLLPIAGSLLVVMALLHFLGERISLFHLSSLLLVLGLGLDYTLFFNRTVDSPAQRNQTVASILICGTTTILVFGLLSFSEIPVFRAIGLTVALGTLMSFACSAMLARNDVASRASLR